MRVEEGPWRDHDQESESCAAETDVECMVNVLRAEADEEGDDAGQCQEAICEEFG